MELVKSFYFILFYFMKVSVGYIIL